MSLSLHPDTPQARTLPGTAPAGAVSGAAAGRGIRMRLFTKYVALFVAVALLANGLFEVFFYYREHKASLIGSHRAAALDHVRRAAGRGGLCFVEQRTSQLRQSLNTMISS